MKNARCRALLAVVITFMLISGWGISAALAQLREAAQGVWVEEDGEAWIEIAPCEDALCGRIVWLKEPLDKAGQPHVDTNNPDPALRAAGPVARSLPLSCPGAFECVRQAPGVSR